jgi:type IV secretory pathway VirB10-like protein
MSGDEKDIIECQRLLDHTHDFFPFSQIRIIQSSTSPCKLHYRRRKVKHSVWFFLLIFGLTAALPASAQIYQWKDKDGKTHFSDIPPPPDQSGVQTKAPKRAQPAASPEPDEAEATTEGSIEPGNAAAAAPDSVKEKSQAQQRDEEFRKRRAVAAEAREKAEKDAARREQREQNCQRARAQLAALSSGQRFSLATGDGGRRVLNDEERAAEITRAEELIKGSCDKD